MDGCERRGGREQSGRPVWAERQLLAAGRPARHPPLPSGAAPVVDYRSNSHDWYHYRRHSYHRLNPVGGLTQERLASLRCSSTPRSHAKNLEIRGLDPSRCLFSRGDLASVQKGSPRIS